MKCLSWGNSINEYGNIVGVGKWGGGGATGERVPEHMNSARDPTVPTILHPASKAYPKISHISWPNCHDNSKTVLTKLINSQKKYQITAIHGPWNQFFWDNEWFFQSCKWNISSYLFFTQRKMLKVGRPKKKRKKKSRVNLPEQVFSFSKSTQKKFPTLTNQ